MRDGFSCRVPAPEAEVEAAEAAPGRYPSPGSPIRPGTSGSPAEAAAEAAVEAVAAEVAVEELALRNCR